jgi:hypothetical protein
VAACGCRWDCCRDPAFTRPGNEDGDHHYADFDDDNEVIDLRGFVNTTSSIEAMAVTDMAGAFPDRIGLKNRRREKMSPFLADSQR